MATLFDGISQQLDFTSCGEEGSSSDNSSDDYVSRIRSPRIRSPRICSPRIQSPSSACRTPRAQRHRSRSNTLSSPVQCTSPIPYTFWKKLRLCDSPSTPKVEDNLEWLSLVCPLRSWIVCQSVSQISKRDELHFSLYYLFAELAIEVVPALLKH